MDQLITKVVRGWTGTDLANLPVPIEVAKAVLFGLQFYGLHHIGPIMLSRVTQVTPPQKVPTRMRS